MEGEISDPPALLFGESPVPRRLTTAIPHAHVDDIVEVRRLGAALAATLTRTLLKTSSTGAIRLVVPAGKQIAEQRASGDFAVQCVEG